MKRDKQRLKHILKAIRNIEAFVEGKSYNDLEDDLVLKSAIMAQLMIIGEAANHISNELRSRYNDIEWDKVVGLRNVLIHEYFGVVWEIVWGTIKEDLPRLKSSIADILQNLEE